MQHQVCWIGVVILLLLVGCAAKYQVHPGALDVTDSAAFDTLLVAESIIDQAKQQPDLKDIQPALDGLVKSYNMARAAWLAYREGLSRHDPQKDVFLALQDALSALEGSIQQFKGVQR